MFSDILNKWEEKGQGWRQRLCSSCLGTSWAQIPFAEQIHKHLDSKKIWLLSTLFSVTFLLLDGIRHIGAHNYLLNKHGRRNKKSLEGPDQF